MRRILVLLLFFDGCSSLAQDCAQTMPAIMVDEQRTFVTGITADRLQAKLGSVKVPITKVERIMDFRVLILFDISASMKTSDAPFGHLRKVLALVKATLDELISKLPQGTRVEYGLFNTRAVFGPEFSANPDDLRRSLLDLNEMMSRGPHGTALYDVLQEALARFGPPQPGDSVLIVTDGIDNESRLRAEKIQQESAQKGIRLFSILIRGNDVDFQGGGQVILDLAERTGGSVYVINVNRNLWNADKAPEEERQELQRFWNNEVISGYLLHFNVPAAAKGQRKWMLSVDRLPGQRSKILAAYPSRLNACPETTAATH